MVSLRVLIVEANPEDVTAMLVRLRARYPNLTWRACATLAEYTALLDESWDMILCAYTLPDWDGMAALAELHARGLDIPFIVVTYHTEEAIIQECFDKGAVDFLFKDRLTRLAPAVFMALQRKQDRLARDQVEARFRRTVMSLPIPLIIHAESGEILLVNEQWQYMTGYTPAELPDIMTWIRLAFPETSLDVAERRTRFDDAFALPLGQSIAAGEYLLRTKTGERRTWEFYSSALDIDEQGRRLMLSVGFDVTERKAATQALTTSHYRLTQVLNTIPDVIIALDRQGHILFASLALTRVFGYMPEAVMGKPLTMLMPERYRVRHIAGYTAYLATHIPVLSSWQAVVLVGLHADGHEVPIEVTFTEVLNDPTMQFLGMIRDTIDKEALAAEIQHVALALKEPAPPLANLSADLLRTSQKLREIGHHLQQVIEQREATESA